MLSGKAKLGTTIGRKGAEADYVIDLLWIRKTVEEQWNTLSSKQQTQHTTLDKEEILRTAEKIYHPGL